MDEGLTAVYRLIRDAERLSLFLIPGNFAKEDLKARISPFLISFTGLGAYFSDRDRLFQIQRDRQGSSI